MTERYLGSIISPSPVEPTGSFADQTASGVWNIHDPLLFGQASDWPVTGNVNPGKFIESIFACAAYTGTGSSLTVNTGVLNSTESTGIDLSNEGGLVWTKRRDSTSGNGPFLNDTERGITKYITSAASSAETDNSGSISAVTSSGYTMGTFSGWNASGGEYVSWIFRKQPKFFDIVTYTGDGATDRDINHSLGSEPGMIWIKRTDDSESWIVYHRSLHQGGGSGTTAYWSKLELESTGAQNGGTRLWGSGSGEDHTTTTFHVSSSSSVNASSATYVAYLFAHNNNDGGFGSTGDQDIIKCDSFVNNSSSVGVEVDLGFEPQFLLIKGATSDSGLGNWALIDNVRGATVDGQQRLYANASSAEGTSNWFKFTSRGFTPNTYFDGTLIYMAIRRGPMRTPATGPEIFDVTETGTDNNRFTTDLKMSDVNWQKKTAETEFWFAQSRLTGNVNYMKLNDTTQEQSYSSSDPRGVFDEFATTSDPQKQKVRAYTSSQNVIYSFKRAPKVFDVVTYTGTGSNQTIKHNLDAAPEIIITKRRDSSRNWAFSTNFSSSSYTLAYFNDGYAPGASGSSYDTAMTAQPSSTEFFVGSSADTNNSGGTYLAYLFATLEGISKVGTYSGTGSDVNVDCGFSNGSFVVIVKRLDSSGDWYIWDSNRGIVSGNDPYNIINSTAAAVDNTDYIDPLSSGFTITSNAGSDLNASGGTYVFLAIAK